MLNNDFYLCFSDKRSGQELQRKSRKLRWKQFIDMPELDDAHAEEKAAELERLIALWRTSEKRRKTYEEMERMEVCSVVVLVGSSLNISYKLIVIHVL